MSTIIAEVRIDKEYVQYCNNLPDSVIFPVKCPRITHVIDIVRIPFIDEIAPAGTFVLKIAFVFFTIEKHNMNVRKLLAEKMMKNNLIKMIRNFYIFIYLCLDYFH